MRIYTHRTYVCARLATRAALCALFALAALAFAPLHASASTIVDTSQCTPSQSLTFGMVLDTPIKPARPCKLQFGSTTGTASLRLRQADNSGAAMFGSPTGDLDPSLIGHPSSPDYPAAGWFSYPAPIGAWTGLPNTITQPDGKVLVTGTLSGTTTIIYRLNNDGSLDETWSNDGLAVALEKPSAEYLRTVKPALAPDGSLYLAVDDSGLSSIVKFGPDGEIDKAFDGDTRDFAYPGNGMVRCECVAPSGHNEIVTGIAVQPDGKVVYAVSKQTATDTQWALIRRGSDGAIDTSFGSNGVATFDPQPGIGESLDAMILEESGKITVTGSTESAGLIVARFTAAGDLDTTFNAPDGFGFFEPAGPDIHRGGSLIQDQSGRYVLAGGYDAGNDDEAQEYMVIRVTADGELDESFSANNDGFTLISPAVPFASGELTGNALPPISSLQQTPHGGLVASILGSTLFGLGDSVLVLTEDGEPDPAFSSNGRSPISGIPDPHIITDTVVAPDGKLLSVGLSNDGQLNMLHARWDTSTVEDYENGATDFDNGPSSFGFCLQDNLGGATSTPLNTSATCPLTSSNAWNPVATTRGTDSIVADTTTVGTTSASATLHFGLRGGTATPGSYQAPLVVDVVSTDLLPPSNDNPPVVSGTAQEKRTLSSTRGDWNGSPTITYQRSWLRCDAAGDNCAAISNANGPTYVPTDADVGSTIRHRIVATNSEGSADSVSTQTAVITAWKPTLAYFSGGEHSLVTQSPAIYSSVVTGGGGSVTAESANQWNFRSGTRSLRITTAAGNDNYAAHDLGAAPAAVTRAYVRIDELPATTLRIMSVEATAGSACAVEYEPTTQTLRGRIGGAWQEGPEVEARQWYMVEMSCRPNSATRELDWAVDAQPQTQVSTAIAASTVGSWRLGSSTDNASASLLFDDMAYSLDTNDYPLGHAKVLGYGPSGVGAIDTPGSFGYSTTSGAGWTSFAGGDANSSPGRSTYLNDWPSTGVELWRQTNTAGEIEIQLGNIAFASDTPNAVRFIGAHMEDIAGNNRVSARFTDDSGGATNLYTDQDVDTTLGYWATIADNQHDAGGAECPAAPCPWTRDAFNNTSMILDATNVDSEIRTDSVMAEVEFRTQPAPVNVTPPVISGLLREGAAISASDGTWTGSPGIVYHQWLRCNAAGAQCTDIGLTDSTYTLTAGDVGSTIRVMAVAASTQNGKQTKLSAPVGPISSAAPTLTYHTGFEHGTKSTAGTGLFNTETISGSGSLEVESGLARSGTYALSSVLTGGDAATWQKNTSGSADHVVRFSIMLTQQPSGIARIFELDDLGAGAGALRLMVDTNLQTRLDINNDDSNPWEVQQSGGSIELFRWHTFELVIEGATGDARWMIDGVEQTSASCGCALAPDAARFGLWTSTSLTAAALYDDIALSETAADFPIGTGRGSALVPSGIGTVTIPASFEWSTNAGLGWTAFNAGDENQTPGRAAYLDDWPVNVTISSDRIRQNATAGDISINLSDTNEPLAINSLRGIAAINDVGAGSNELGYTEGGAPSYIYSGLNAGASIEYRAGTAARRATSAGGGEWTPSAVNDTYLIVDTAAAVTQAINALMVEVDAPTSPAPVNTTQPQLLTPYASMKVGDTLSVDNGTWTGDTGFFSYSWLRCTPAVNAEDSCVGISGATSSSYTIQAADLGTRIRALVTTNGYIATRQVAATNPTTLIANQTPTLSFVTGFEAGHTAALGATLTFPATPTADIEASAARTGAYGMRAYPTGETAHYGFSTGGADQYVVRQYVRFTNFPLLASPGAPIAIISASDTAKNSMIRVDQNGQSWLSINDGADCQITGGPSLEPGAWHLIEHRFHMNATTWTADASIDGAPLDTTVCTGRTPTTTDLFAIGPGMTADMAIDDVATSATWDDYPIGPGRVEPLLLNGVGTHAGAASLRDDAAAALTPFTWNRMDELPMGGTGDFVEQHTIGANDYAEWLFADPLTTATARLVKVTVGTHSSSATANNATTKIVRQADNDATAPIIHTGDMSGTGLAYRILNVPPPAGGWTHTELQNLKLRTGYATNTDSLPAWDNAITETEYRD